MSDRKPSSNRSSTSKPKSPAAASALKPGAMTYKSAPSPSSLATPSFSGRPTNNSQAAALPAQSAASTSYETTSLPYAGTSAEGKGHPSHQSNAAETQHTSEAAPLSEPPSSPRRSSKSPMELFCADSSRERTTPERSMTSVPDYGDLFKGEIPLEGLDILLQPLQWSLQRD